MGLWIFSMFNYTRCFSHSEGVFGKDAMVCVHGFTIHIPSIYVRLVIIFQQRMGDKAYTKMQFDRIIDKTVPGGNPAARTVWSTGMCPAKFMYSMQSDSKFRKAIKGLI